MPISDISIGQVVGEPSRYDLVLAAIPAAFVLALAISQFVGVPTRVGLGTASAVSGAVLIDALFRNPPNRGRFGGSNAAG